jgi:Arc/MetJ-type ribon-helix-helix transcriptional regulator
MKIKISISIDENTVKNVEEIVKNGSFRNKSHFIEFATQRQINKSKDSREKK